MPFFFFFFFFRLSFFSCLSSIHHCTSRFINYTFSVLYINSFPGIFVAAHDLKIEWVIVKGVCDFVGASRTPDESWKAFACVMAASVVFNMLNDPIVFEDWPHYQGM